jgi:hypothetical protein
MPLYQFHFVGPNGNRPALDFSERPDDGAAAREALEQLGQHRSALSVEVWEDQRLVVRLERDSEALPEISPGTGAGSHRRKITSKADAVERRPGAQ